MEHKIVLGGEQFLPFARSRIRALRALGLPYADQSFEIDGVSIKVRIEPGHEYIRLDGGGTVYMESGQLEWTLPGELNPEKYDPAKWHFLDVPTTDKYLGWINARYGQHLGEQKNKPALSEGMDSQAIGYPTKTSLTAEQTADLKAAYGDRTLLKKLVAAIFPPSLFSGKMRLFMQAKYGALAEKDYSPFTVDIFGLSGVLYYIDRSGNSLQFGLWAHASPGIYTSPEGNYWLINFRSGGTGEFVATAYPLKLAAEAAGLRKKVQAPDSSELERTQCEAYILAGADIDLSAGQVIGTVTGADGFALSYGWKFSRSGSKASIVLIQAFDNGSGYDKYYKARTVHCNITSTTDEAGITNLLLVSTVEQHGDWNYDTWAEYNIFVPESEELIGPLFCISREQPSAMRAEFNFSDVAIYGYYVGETWTPVKIGRTIPPGPWPKFRNKLGEGFHSSTPASELAELSNAYQYGVVLGGSTFLYEQHSIYSARTMNLSVGTSSFVGVSEYGDHSYFTRFGTGVLTANTVGFPAAALNGAPPAYNPPEYPAGGITGLFDGGVANMHVGNITMEMRSYIGSINDVWALVIPGQDSEAAIVASFHYSSVNTLTLQRSTGNGVTHFSGQTVNGGVPDSNGVYPSPAVVYSFAPWVGANSMGPWYGVAEDLVATTVTESIPPGQYHVNCFSPSVPGAEGVPSGSYYTLFNVDSGNPYYNGIMYFLNSYGGRYAASEHTSSPISVNYQRPFVGWA